ALSLDRDYKTLNNTTIVLSKFKYYVSNIQLTREDGTVWKEQKSYHLVEVNEEQTDHTIINLEGVPQGSYKELSFFIGIDSVANHSGEQEGVLDPDYGMFWMWQTGYTFFKIEGLYTNATGKRNALVLHVGNDNCYK